MSKIDNSARTGPLLGRKAYEEDVRLNPFYPGGGTRPDWDKLGKVEQWSWNKPRPHDGEG